MLAASGAQPVSVLSRLRVSAMASARSSAILANKGSALPRVQGELQLHGCLRHELHRVWVIEGNLKAGSRHIYAKRVAYIDEDTWQIALADHFDARGTLWRVAEGFMTPIYDKQIP